MRSCAVTRKLFPRVMRFSSCEMVLSLLAFWVLLIIKDVVYDALGSPRSGNAGVRLNESLTPIEFLLAQRLQ